MGCLFSGRSAWQPYALTFALSALASCVCIRPPADSSVFLDAATDAGGGLRAKFFLITQSFAESYLPVPVWTSHVWSFWNQPYFNVLPRHLGPLLGFAVLVASIVFFRSTAIRLFFLGGSLVLMAQILVSDPGPGCAMWAGFSSASS